jgi:hypothetical protein
VTSDGLSVELAADPLGFAVAALSNSSTSESDASHGCPERVAAARRAWAVLDPESLPRASLDAARTLASGVRAMAAAGQAVGQAAALEAIEAADSWIERTTAADGETKADAQEARGIARRVAAESGEALDARMLEAAAMDLLAAAQYRKTAGDREASARTDLEIAEVFARFPADDRGPLIERAVGHARRAAATLTPDLDATAHARCQLLLSGLLLDHPKTDPQRFAGAALGLADVALKIVDARQAPLVAARAWQTRARALKLRESADHQAAYAEAAALLEAAGLHAESRRLRRKHDCA